MGEPAGFDIVVVGSINHDITVLTSRLPAPGETVLGTAHYSGGGGKGANQAVAAARLGGRVAMVGRVGNDESGRERKASLSAEGVDIAAVGVDDIAPTGVAVITIDERAENTIVVSPGANATLRPEHLNEDLISAASVVLAQLEVPVDTVTEAARLCSGIFLLNPAPASDLPAELLERVDVIIPNRSELAVLGGDDFQHHGAVVVTLGAEGALLLDGNESHRIPAPSVDAVDPTGAGDAFCAALALALSRNMNLLDAVERAVVSGALATIRPGAQASMPTADEVETLLYR